MAVQAEDWATVEWTGAFPNAPLTPPPWSLLPAQLLAAVAPLGRALTAGGRQEPLPCGRLPKSQLRVLLQAHIRPELPGVGRGEARPGSRSQPHCVLAW